MEFIKTADLALVNPSESVVYMTEKGVTFIGVTGRPAGFYVTDGFRAFVPNGGNGSSAWVALDAPAPSAYVAFIRPAWGSAAPAAQGLGGTGLNGVGTATAASYASTNLFTRTTHARILDTTAGTDSVGGFRLNEAQWSRGEGFWTRVKWGPATGVAVATSRAFAGMIASTSASTDVDPSTLVDMIGMGWDDTDTNVQIMHNDASGTATKIDLGARFARPTVDLTQIYSLMLAAPVGASSVVYRVINWNTGAVATGTLTSNLPATDTQLCGMHVYTSVGGTSGVSGIALFQWDAERPI